VRLAGGSHVDAVVIDQLHQPIAVLRDLKVINISAGGMAVTTTTPVELGSRIQISPAKPSANTLAAGMFPDFEVQVLDCTQEADHTHKIRCRLASGSVPATLLYRW